MKLMTVARRYTQDECHWQRQRLIPDHIHLTFIRDDV